MYIKLCGEIAGIIKRVEVIFLSSFWSVWKYPVSFKGQWL